MLVRKFNTTETGSGFSGLMLLAIWNRGGVIPNKDPSKFRKDVCGAEMQWDKYGNTTTDGFGWEVDHIKPVSAGGKTELMNLRPLQWQNNRAKGDTWPSGWNCAVTFS